MRRADRLFEIIQRLRRGRVVTARSLAEPVPCSGKRSAEGFITDEEPVTGGVL
jgi:predicted DNA-binding transcriptional regulator YafY